MRRIKLSIASPLVQRFQLKVNRRYGNILEVLINFHASIGYRWTKEKQPRPIRFQFTTLNCHTVSIEHGSAEGVWYSSPEVRVENLGLFFVIAIIKKYLFGVSFYDYEPYRFVKSKKFPVSQLYLGLTIFIARSGREREMFSGGLDASTFCPFM